MERYCVEDSIDINLGNQHKVHKEGCPVFPKQATDLGLHPNCSSALINARQYYFRVDGCKFCNPDCHYSQPAQGHE